MRYAIVIERAENNYSAYVPDLPGCIATGATVPEGADTILMQDLYSFEYNDGADGTPGRLVPTGITPMFIDRIKDRGVDLTTEHFRSTWGS